MLRLLLFFALALQVSAQETLFREVFDTATDTHVEVTGLFSKPSQSGYYPVRVKIANNLTTDREIHLDFESGNSHESRSTSTFSLTAPAGKAVTRDIMVPLNPPATYGSSSVAVKLSGSLGRAQGSAYSNFGETQPGVLLSEALFTPNGSTLDSEISSTSKSSYRGSTEFSSKFDPKQLPDNWLAFSGFDSVIMTDQDWGNVPPGQKNAILSWTRLGGQLIIYTSGGTTATELGLPQEPGLGSVSIQSMPTSLKLDAPQTVALVLTGNPAGARSASLRSDFETSWNLQSEFGQQTFRYGLFICVLVVFGILVGPVNLFVFAKAGQRHKLFITTPIISLGASLLLIVLIIVQDGFGGSGMRRVLMEVRPDDGLNAAYIHQEQFSRTGVLGSSNFTVQTPSLFVPVTIAPSRWARYTSGSGATGTFNLQPTDGKLDASGDWFQSRSEQGHVLSAVISTRGRIEATDTPGTYLSTFDFPLKTLYFLDEKGTWYRADDIKVGKRFTPVQVDPTMILKEINDEVSSFSTRNKKFLTAAKSRPGHYIAVTDDAPGIDTNPGIRWKTRTVVTGPVAKP